MRRLSAAILAALFAVGLCVPASFAAASTSKAVPKVVFVAGRGRRHRWLSRTGARRRGHRAALHARRHRALLARCDVARGQGGDHRRLAGRLHGPRERLAEPLSRRPLPADPGRLRAQPGGRRDDSTHQYFGEADIAAQIKLAKNAVVLLNHLCYASGNSEPGLPEGTLDQAQPAGRQLCGRVHQGRCCGGRCRGLVEPVVHGQGDPRRRPIDPDGVAGRARARMATEPRSPARAARATSPRWTPRRRHPGSPDRS